VRLTEEEIRKLTLSAMEQLGEKASPEMVKKIVNSSIDNISTNPSFVSDKKPSGGRVILTSFGMNTTGVVASITEVLASSKCDIEDISQTLMGEYYTIILTFNLEQSTMNLSEVQEEMIKVAEELKIKIYLQHEDIFTRMHRI